MQTPKVFRSSFGTLTGSSTLLVGLALGASPSCALDEAPVLDDPATHGELAGAGDEAGDGPTASVCTQGTYRCHAHVQAAAAGPGFRAHAVRPTGYGPPDLQAAYRIDPGAAVVARPTVAIVIAYGYTAIESDLAVYRSYYGLPPCTIASGCLKVVNELGQSSPLPPDPPPSDDWTVETALDIDMVSAACPACNILVVQAGDNLGEGLFRGQEAAASLGATVISNSWGAPEQPNTSPSQIAATEAYLNRPGVAVFVAAGDDGYNDAGAGPDYPATSAHVIAVGATRLVRDLSARGWSETAWIKGGSACSLAIPKPAYQATWPCPFRATTDIAAVGDPATGVAVYNARVGGWITVGGTSASAPFVAAIFASTGHGGQTSGAFIQSQASVLNDVTIGTNGSCGADRLLCNAAVGWDGPSGHGTPDAAALAGRVFDPKDDPDPEEGGGCSTGSGAGAVLGLAILGVRRRRR
jgi:hypothetical protein